MTRLSNPVAFWRRLNDAVEETGEAQLALSDAHDFYKFGLSCEDALALRLFGVEQSAPPDMTDAFHRTFGRV